MKPGLHFILTPVEKLEDPRNGEPFCLTVSEPGETPQQQASSMFYALYMLVPMWPG